MVSNIVHNRFFISSTKAPLAGPETSWRVRKSPELNSANNPIAHQLAGNFQIPMAARKVGFFEEENDVQYSVFR